MNIPADQGSISALRGTLVFCRDDPFLTDPATAFVREPDGLVICRDGIIDGGRAFCCAQGALPSNRPVPTIRAA